ncbi:G-type lectin S-receptor-like serine/threonine-protein kinase B120 [Beta vulgaris subsp. vulgaris]|uniref:G-type lectin S-receptor-like serine/threonine-protein kinase B120 n=1 Tax=Beta vulgaris subsp. vulgaris TaxID=3555 RepID=UPI002036897E|nr:G-type lectin S-receptor-like serine/threonine-protein kinase B120 [Beta vulgaris subsp. vulgaris]
MTTLDIANSRLFSLLFICFYVKFASAITNITTTKFLRDPQTLVSSNAHFKMGFFSPANSTNRYIGIWYNIEDSNTMEVVWVANRNNPISSSTGMLHISEDGNLQLSDRQNVTFWSSNVSHQTNGSVAYLQDTGNLVLLSSESGLTMWQSFEHLTNSLLPQTRISIAIPKGMHNPDNSSILQSWTTPYDPSTGRFRIGINPLKLPEFVTWDGDKPYWRSGPWNGSVFLGVPFLSMVFVLKKMSKQALWTWYTLCKTNHCWYTIF